MPIEFTILIQEKKMSIIKINAVSFVKLRDIDIPKKNKIIVFPAGKATKLFLRFNKLDISYLCDNNIGVEKEINGIEIIAPQHLKIIKSRMTIIVTSPNLLADIISQLDELNVLELCDIILLKNNTQSIVNFEDDFEFVDRSVQSNKALFVLAGYKPDLWDIVFRRIEKFCPKDIDVCVMTAGKNVEEIKQICAKNSWSYLSTTVNNCCLIQNIAFKLFDNAEWIYKLDEDMFISDGYFDGLYETYIEAEKSHYHVGIVAPLIPVNPHGNILFLKQMSLMNEYETRFGKAYFDFNTHFEYNTEETLYLWEKTLPIDKTAQKFRKDTPSYFVVPHRFSIGGILFRRGLWEELGGFTVSKNNGLGADEFYFAEFSLAMTNFYTYIVSKNTLAGHYSFGQIEDKEKLDKFYIEHYQEFDIQEV
jgi:hypothetical protein